MDRVARAARLVEKRIGRGIASPGRVRFQSPYRMEHWTYGEPPSNCEP
jgi:hypothetical protein